MKAVRLAGLGMALFSWEYYVCAQISYFYFMTQTSKIILLWRLKDRNILKEGNAFQEMYLLIQYEIYCLLNLCQKLELITEFDL